MKIRFIVILALASTPISWAVQVTGDSANVGSSNTVQPGSNSAAVGASNTVGENSFTIGTGNYADQIGFAGGEGNTVAGAVSSAFGSENYIDVLLGINADASSFASSVIGHWNYLEKSDSSIVSGRENWIYREKGSFVAGTGNAIWSEDSWTGGGGLFGQSNIVLGYCNYIDKNVNIVSESILLGKYNETQESQSWAIGLGNIGQSGTVTLGTYSATVSNASLIVGTGTGGGTTPRTNGLVVLKNGTVSIPSGLLQLGSESALTATSSAPVMASYLANNNYLKKNTGIYSTAASTAICSIGTSSNATGTGSISIGDYTLASGDQSICLGPNSRATAWATIAIQGSAEAYQSTAIGPGSTTYGAASVAIGYGSSTTLYGHGGLALGTNAQSNSAFANAIGFHATGNGWVSTALGSYSEANGWGSLSAGFATRAHASRSTALGTANIGNQGNTYDWIESDPIFELGNSNDGNNRSNAITTLKNGQTTLINKAWKANVAANPTQTLADPPATTTDSGGEALVVDGHTRLRGKVVIEQPQGDISMGIYGN